ncbi:MAG: hypothetical protein ACPIOQ_42605, partial [Promethearchaeia archaeon]
LREPNGLTADAMYPGRLVVEDAFGVSVGQEFMLRVCSSLVPYMVTSSGISLYATHAGRIAPVFIRTTHQDPRQGEHQPAGGTNVMLAVRAASRSLQRPMLPIRRRKAA